MRLSLLGLFLASASLFGCGSGSSSGGASALGPQDPGNPLPFSQVGDPVPQDTATLKLKRPIEVLHSGEVKVEFFDASGLLVQSYREEVTTDGVSRFSLKPIESLIDVPDDWIHRKRIREGYAFRYGSFSVRDKRILAQNFSIEYANKTRKIAGKTCQQFSVTSNASNGFSYQIWVEPRSGLALRTEHRDARGYLRFTREYESLDLAPNLDRAIWFTSIHNELSLDLSQPLEDQIGMPVLLPKLLPTGYALIKAYRLVQGEDVWIKLVYTNGIEPLFMLQRPNAPKSNKPENSNSSGKTIKQAPERLIKNTDERLYVLALDGVVGVYTEQPEGTFEVVGIVDEHELVDMIISTLP